MASPNLQLAGWIPGGFKYSIYTGRGAGSEGLDAAMGHGPQGNQATITIQLRWEDLLLAIPNILGEYNFSLNSGYLQRSLPIQHPMFKWLYASRIVGIHPMRLTGRDQPDEFVATFPTYTHALVTILFTQPHYPVIEDAVLDNKFAPVDTGGGITVRQEWMRYMEWTPKVGLETMVIESGKMVFAEGTGAGGQPTGGTTVTNVPTLKYLAKGSLLGIWRFVPWYGLISPTTYRPENLITALGTVNSAAFMNYPAGTLRLDSYDFNFNEAPYDPARFLPGIDGANQGRNQFVPSLTVDVTLCWSFFDPPHSHSAYRGHNMCPFRSDPDGSWYLVTVDGNAAHDTLVPSSDHRRIFRRAA